MDNTLQPGATRALAAQTLRGTRRVEFRVQAERLGAALRQARDELSIKSVGSMRPVLRRRGKLTPTCSPEEWHALHTALVAAYRVALFNLYWRLKQEQESDDAASKGRATGSSQAP